MATLQQHRCNALGTMLVCTLITGIISDASAEEPGAFWKKYYRSQPQKTTTGGMHPVVNDSSAANAEFVALSSICEALAVPYRTALRTYQAKAARYWNEILRKRKIRRARRRKKLTIRRADYVLIHPPGYKGPSRPKCLNKGKTKPQPKSTLPLVSDFRFAAKKLYGFIPRRSTEWEYKRIFAREALAIGLTANQVVGVYALETGGIGPYSRQSGIFITDNKCKPISPRGRAASTALGYAQLLAANTAIMVREFGHRLARRLERYARRSAPDRARELRRKANLLRHMSRDVSAGLKRYKGRSNWNRYRAFAKTPRGYAVHALLLDPDIGPLLQSRKLKRIVDGALSRGFSKVSAAQLELMNLAGPGTGLEMMTRVGSNVPTANFFSRGGHDRNPVVKNRLAKGLLNKLAERIRAQMGKCGSKEFLAAFRAASR